MTVIISITNLLLYRSSLFSRVSRHKSKLTTCTSIEPPSKHVTYKRLSSPEKVHRMRELRKENIALKRKITTLKAKVADMIEKEVVELDEELSSDMFQMVKEQQANIDKLPEDYFQRIYWNQQLEAAKKHRNGMRWHPLTIRWCLYLRHLSSKAYDTLREWMHTFAITENTS